MRSGAFDAKRGRRRRLAKPACPRRPTFDATHNALAARRNDADPTTRLAEDGEHSSLNPKQELFEERPREG